MRIVCGSIEIELNQPFHDGQAASCTHEQKFRKPPRALNYSSLRVTTEDWRVGRILGPPCMPDPRTPPRFLSAYGSVEFLPKRKRWHSETFPRFTWITARVRPTGETKARENATLREHCCAPGGHKKCCSWSFAETFLGPGNKYVWCTLLILAR